MKNPFIIFKKKSIGFKGIQADKAVNIFIPREYLFIPENNYIFYSNKKNKFSLQNSNVIRRRYNSSDNLRKQNLNQKYKPIKENLTNISIIKKYDLKNQYKITNVEEEEKNDEKLPFIPNFSTFGGNNKYMSIPLYNNNFFNILCQKKSQKKNENFVNLFGIKNIGNSCYINSFLQILLRTPFFYENLKIVNNNENISLIKNLIELNNNSKKELIIKKIKILMSEVDETYKELIQNDSQDFGINLINYLIILLKGENSFDDEIDENTYLKENIPILDLEKHKNGIFKNYLNKYYKKENEIFIEKMFQFHESKLLMEANANEQKIYEAKKIYFETSISIDLNFPKKNDFSLEDLLSYRYPEFHNFYKDYTKIDEQDEFDWDKIKEYVYRLYKTILDACLSNFKDTIDIGENDNNIRKNIKSFCFRRLASLPNILIISINRASVGKSLNNSFLSFKETLDLRDYIDEDIYQEKETQYTLYAVNERKGLIKNFGHCYSYVKIKNRWFKFDDDIYYEEKPNFNSKYVVGLYYIKNNFKL